MKNSKLLKAILIVSGLIGVAVGVTLLFNPIPLYASVGIDIAGQISLLSDLRATGGSLSILGALIVLGAFIPRLSFTSTVVATALFLSYGTSRIYGMVTDGMPDAILVQVTVLEFLVGFTCLSALVRYSASEQASEGYSGSK